MDYDKIKRINSEIELSEFTRQYLTKNKFHFVGINWKKVSEKYNGFEISNQSLIKSFVTHPTMRWITDWDIVSGVIWNKACINNVEEIISDKKDAIRNQIYKQHEQELKQCFFGFGLQMGLGML